MNIDIENSDCIVVQQEGGEVGKRGVGLAGSPDSAGTSTSPPSLGVGVSQKEGEGVERAGKAGEAAGEGREGWTVITRKRARAAAAVGAGTGAGAGSRSGENSA
jgi:hypothetical protein